MDAADAAAIASVCAAVVGVATLATNVYLAKQGEKIHGLVNGMSERRARTARAAGVAEGRRKGTKEAAVESMRTQGPIVQPPEHFGAA